LVDDGFIRTLGESDDPLMAVWAEMPRACAVQVMPEDLRSWYDEREEALNLLERAVYEGYFEAYDELLRVATSDAGRWAEELLDKCPLVLIADSLSVREVGLLAARWKPAGRQIRVEGNGFAVVPFPPMTSSLSRSRNRPPHPRPRKRARPL
jgi:hypothetical protein